jgi:hypothetical protein
MCNRMKDNNKSIKECLTNCLRSSTGSVPLFPDSDESMACSHVSVPFSLYALLTLIDILHHLISLPWHQAFSQTPPRPDSALHRPCQSSRVPHLPILQYRPLFDFASHPILRLLPLPHFHMLYPSSSCSPATPLVAFLRLTNPIHLRRQSLPPNSNQRRTGPGSGEQTGERSGHTRENLGGQGNDFGWAGVRSSGEVRTERML